MLREWMLHDLSREWLSREELSSRESSDKCHLLQLESRFVMILLDRLHLHRLLLRGKSSTSRKTIEIERAPRFNSAPFCLDNCTTATLDSRLSTLVTTRSARW